MRSAGWYVIQVQTGRGRIMCRLIERVAAEASAGSDVDGFRLLEECFSPQYRTRRKFGGEWRDIEKSLLPGYVIAVTAHPGELAHVLRSVPDFTRLLNMGETFVPLRTDERAWIEEFTHRGDRTIPMSVAYKKGDTVVVTEGPLVGHEGMITRVNRSKCLAHVEIHAGALTIRTTVGLAVLPEGAAGAISSEGLIAN